MENTENELIGELHEQLEYTLFGNQHTRRAHAQAQALYRQEVVDKLDSLLKSVAEDEITTLDALYRELIYLRNEIA
jgi:hypothetical protein